MNDDRIHACLDGLLPREALTDEESARLAALEAPLENAVALLRSVSVPDLTDRVLDAIPPARPKSARAGLTPRLIEWLWRPVAIRLRPINVLGGLAVVLLTGVVLLPRGMDRRGPIPESSAASRQTRLYVQFRLDAPGATRVEMAGSFTGWKPAHELTEVAPGVWSVMVPLAPGVYDYNFVIDGQRMVVDPNAPRVADGFGGNNSRLFLPAPSGRV